MIKINKFFIAFSFIFIFIACNNKHKNYKGINFSNDLKQIQSSSIKAYEGKMIAYFDAGCSVCISKMNKIIKYVNSKKTKKNYNIKLIFILTANNIGYIHNAIQMVNYDKCDIYYDEKDVFKKNNNVFEKYNTVLVNNKNQVLVGGCPLFNEKTKELYNKEIEKLYINNKSH